MSMIFKRVSTRAFTNRIPTGEEIEKILSAAMAAPTANNKRPFHFIVIKNRKTLDEIMKFHPYAEMLKTAPIVIAACGDRTLEENDGYLAVDLAACTQNMLLQAEELSLGTCWLGIYPRVERIEALSRLLKLPAHILPVSLVALGEKAVHKEQKERFLPERVHDENW